MFFFEFLTKIAIIGIRPTLRGYELFDITSCLEPPVLPHVFTFYFSFCIQCYLEGIPIFTEILFLDILTYIFDYYIKEMKWIFFRLRYWKYFNSSGHIVTSIPQSIPRMAWGTIFGSSFRGTVRRWPWSRTVFICCIHFIRVLWFLPPISNFMIFCKYSPHQK